MNRRIAIACAIVLAAACGGKRRHPDLGGWDVGENANGPAGAVRLATPWPATLPCAVESLRLVSAPAGFWYSPRTRRTIEIDPKQTPGGIGPDLELLVPSLPPPFTMRFVCAAQPALGIDWTCAAAGCTPGATWPLTTTIETRPVGCAPEDSCARLAEGKAPGTADVIVDPVAPALQETYDAINAACGAEVSGCSPALLEISRQLQEAADVTWTLVRVDPEKDGSMTVRFHENGSERGPVLLHALRDPAHPGALVTDIAIQIGARWIQFRTDATGVRVDTGHGSLSLGRGLVHLSGDAAR